MKSAHILILTFVLLVAVAVGAYIIHDRHNNTANMGYNGERRNITTFSEYIGDERVVFYPVIETLEAFGAKVQEENDRYIIHVGDKKYILEQNEHPLYDGDAVTLFDTKMPEQNLLLIPPGSYGSPTRIDGDVYVNDATITHVFTQMGLEGYLDEIDVMISEANDLASANWTWVDRLTASECRRLYDELQELNLQNNYSDDQIKDNFMMEKLKEKLYKK